MSTTSTQQSHSEGRPKVLIAGGGLGGLTMGLLLHKAGIPFEIYERATDVKPLGTSQLGHTPLCLFPLSSPFSLLPSPSPSLSPVPEHDVMIAIRSIYIFYLTQT